MNMHPIKGLNMMAPRQLNNLKVIISLITGNSKLHLDEYEMFSTKKFNRIKP
jgi:hypothetical protein